MQHGKSGTSLPRHLAKSWCGQLARPGEAVRVPQVSYRKAPTEGEGFYAGRGVKKLVVDPRHPVRKSKSGR